VFEFIEQRPGLFEIGGSEAFGKPAVDRREQIAGFAQPALLSAQAGEARCAAQFPGLRVLAACDVDALLDGRLGLAHCPGAGEQGLAAEPIKLRFKRCSPVVSTIFSPAATDSSAASGSTIANCASACNANSQRWNPRGHSCPALGFGSAPSRFAGDAERPSNLTNSALQRDYLAIGKGEAFGLQSDDIDEQCGKEFGPRLRQTCQRVVAKRPGKGLGASEEAC
jgi:hypothetical protein